MSISKRLNNGVEIPLIGLGTYKIPDGLEVERVVHWALELGYRHIDTASFYENEAGIGKALKESGIEREEVFLTSKVWNDSQGYNETLRAFDESRRKLKSDVLDLYLIHWPVKGLYKETWKALEHLYKEGKVRAIGVSNFLVHHLKELLASTETVPAVNQIELHPFLLQREVLDFCRERGIGIVAWSPLARANKLHSETLTKIAEHRGKSPAQIILRWDIQQGIVAIPKSSHKERLHENLDIFDFTLSNEEMKAIDGLDSGNRIGPHPDEFG